MSEPPPRSVVRGRRIATVLLALAALVGAVVVAALLIWLVPLALEAFT